MGEVRNIIKVACIYIATIIGAGFASGQEIVQFFSIYYKGGFYGVILAGILFSIIGCILLDKVYTERIQGYDEFLFPSTGHLLGRIMDIIITLFMLSVFCVMIAGMGNIFLDKTGIPFSYGVILAVIFCMAAILSDLKGIISISTITSPILIAGIIIVGLYILTCKDVSAFNFSNNITKLTKNWFFSSLIYVSYNSIISSVVMCSLLPYLKTRKVGIMGGILGGLLLCLIALVLNCVIFLFYPGSFKSEIPMLDITHKLSNIINIIYTLILWLAMFVSAVTSGYCLVDRVKTKVKVNVKLLVVIICVIAIPLSNIGFSNLISSVYPLFGYLGLFMILIILLQGFKKIIGR
jgi:uncharacterized membrane protein YkvI